MVYLGRSVLNASAIPLTPPICANMEITFVPLKIPPINMINHLHQIKIHDLVQSVILNILWTVGGHV